MNKWNMIIDVAKCENCHNCTLALKDEHVDNDFPGYAAPQPRHGHDWIKINRKVRGSGHLVDAAYLPTMCNHCDDAPCVKAGAADGSVRKRDDGIVIIDPEKAKGRRDLVDSCPYNAIWWNEEQNLPQIWIFDAHLLDKGWAQPRAAQSCPTSALKAVKVTDAEMQAKAQADGLEVLKPELGTRPRVYYSNLHRFEKCFIGGSVVAQTGGVIDCVEGATVTLSRNGTPIATQSTDIFGDFKFDALAPASGSYQVRVSHAELGVAQADVALEDISINLGTLSLARA